MTSNLGRHMRSFVTRYELHRFGDWLATIPLRSWPSWSRPIYALAPTTLTGRSTAIAHSSLGWFTTRVVGKHAASILLAIDRWREGRRNARSFSTDYTLGRNRGS